MPGIVSEKKKLMPKTFGANKFPGSYFVVMLIGQGQVTQATLRNLSNKAD